MKIALPVIGESLCNIFNLSIATGVFPDSAGGGEYLVYLSDGDVPFFRVSFSPIFSRTGYQKRANFLTHVVKTCQKRKFCYNWLLFSQIFVF